MASAATSVSTLLERSGVSRGTLFHYAATKQDLLAAVFELYVRSIHAFADI
jgi:AcrR family transcriptional regulator